jgi:flagellar motor switch protein FliN/FliY
MDDGLLSQEDIDALTASLMGTSGSTNLFNADSIRGTVDAYASKAGEVLGTLLSRPVEWAVRDIRAGDAAGVVDGYEADTVCMKTGFKQGITGELALLLRKDVAGAMADWMVGGDGTAEWSHDNLDALSEMGNQIQGAQCTHLGGRFDLSIAADQASVIDFNPTDPPFDLSESALVDLEMFAEGESKGMLRLVLSQPLVVAFADPSATEDGDSTMGGGNDFGSPSPQPSGAPSVHSSMTMPSSTGRPNVDMLLDVPLNVTIELGRTRLSIRRILELGPGSIIELDRLAGEPVDLLVNDKVVARGEVVVVDEYFGIRILSLISPEERIKQLR